VVGASNLVGPTFVAHLDRCNVETYSDQLVASGPGEPRPGGAGPSCPPTQLVPGPSWGGVTRGPQLGRTVAPGRGVRLCPGCSVAVDRQDHEALRMPDGWWHRQCWIATAPEREERLRSIRADVGRHRALAGYLLAQDEWGGLPAVVVRANLVGRSIDTDNECSRYHKVGSADDNRVPAPRCLLLRRLVVCEQAPGAVDLARRMHRFLDEDGCAPVIQLALYPVMRFLLIKPGLGQWRPAEGALAALQ